MSRKPRYGPQPGETARLTELNLYPLLNGIKAGDIGYVVEFQGGEYTIDVINVVCPFLGLREEHYCPYCHKQLRRDGQFYICVSIGCSFRCYVNRPASVIQ